MSPRELLTAEFFNSAFLTLSASHRDARFLNRPKIGLHSSSKHLYNLSTSTSTRGIAIALTFIFNAFRVPHACPNTVRSLFYHCWLLHATAVPRREQSDFFPE